MPEKMTEYLSTTEAGKLCEVDRRTMLRWVDQGLVAHHLTGGGRRRIRREDLVVFMRERGMPIPRGLDSGPPRVVVVDDDPNFAASMRRFVARQVPGADIRVAEDGFAAGLLISEFRPQLVLLDIVMPGMNGFEVLHRIRERRELDGTAVVVVSANVTPSVAAALRADGAVDALSKPPELGRLKALLGRCLPTGDGGER